jgi:hypothetical protein
MVPFPLRCLSLHFSSPIVVNEPLDVVLFLVSLQIPELNCNSCHMELQMLSCSVLQCGAAQGSWIRSAVLYPVELRVQLLHSRRFLLYRKPIEIYVQRAPIPQNPAHVSFPSQVNMLILWIALIWGAACLSLTTLWILMAPGMQTVLHLWRYSPSIENRDLSYF